jgi:hypothetical protein
MAPGPIEQGLEQVFRAYGRALRTVASAVPGDAVNKALDDAADVLRRALDLPSARENLPPASAPMPDPPLESAPAATISENPAAELEGSAATVEFGTVAGESDAAPAAPFSYSIPRPGESGRRGTIFATYEAEISAPIERCWDVAADVVNAPAWTPPLLEARVAAENTTAEPTVFDTIADAKVRKTKAKLRFEFDRPRGMRWEQLSGDQKFLIGAWEFEPQANGNVRALYLVEIDLGRALGLVLRGPVLERVKDMLTRGSVEGLKETVE